MKDPICLALPRRSREPTTGPWAYTDGPLVSTKLGYVHKGNVRVRVDIKIGEEKEAPSLGTQSESKPATYSSAPTLTSESVGISSETTHPSTNTLTIGMMMVSQEFL